MEFKGEEVNIYWKFRLWWMNNIPSWNRISFVVSQRWASIIYSLSVWDWHKPCIECWGSKTSMKYGQLQPCRLGCGVGYQRIHFWMDMKEIFYPSQRIYHLQQWFKRVVYGCSKRNEKVWHQYCRFGTCGCDHHPLTHDWEGKPLEVKS
jgi:hypothetical protein